MSDSGFLDRTLPCGCHVSTGIDENGDKAFLLIACSLEEKCPFVIKMIEQANRTGKPVRKHHTQPTN